MCCKLELTKCHILKQVVLKESRRHWSNRETHFLKVTSEYFMIIHQVLWLLVVLVSSFIVVKSFDFLFLCLSALQIFLHPLRKVLFCSTPKNGLGDNIILLYKFSFILQGKYSSAQPPKMDLETP